MAPESLNMPWPCISTGPASVVPVWLVARAQSQASAAHECFGPGRNSDSGGMEMPQIDCQKHAGPESMNS
uniref:Uncharacterized protein n=1 Tax=Spironucleus salmonicida TaxID=348837 RepID=V6LYU8_9EUKA|eukprot:EST48906.1 Hypothetical protein SS50377_10850 [Spironucleus salmonicida]